MNRQFRILVIAIVASVFVSPGWLLGQDGVSSMSMGLSRAGLIPRFEQIRIEEYINYHQHAIPRPEGDRRVHLDLKWNRLEGDKAIVQVGLATSQILDPDRMPPLNLVLVVDRSGSMSGDRIANVKKSLLSFIERLRPSDLVTIVGFSDDARVELESCNKTRQKEIRKAIDRIEASGSTNLHGGLMLGYKWAEQNFDAGRSNRVILLTDGIANVGTTEPGAIAAESKVFNKKGISLSTIGLGHDLNQDLLRDLADAGHGLIHFVDDAADIEKTFIRELDSLLAPAAHKVRVTIESADAKPSKIYGYDPKERAEEQNIRLDDLNHGATQIVLSEWALSESPVDVRVTLSYVDAISGEKQEQTATVTLVRNAEDEVLDDVDLSKNYSIAVLADALRDSVKLVHDNNSEQAIKRISKSIRFAREHSRDDDADVARMVDIAKACRERMKSIGEVSRRD